MDVITHMTAPKLLHFLSSLLLIDYFSYFGSDSRLVGMQTELSDTNLNSLPRLAHLCHFLFHL